MHVDVAVAVCFEYDVAVDCCGVYVSTAFCSRCPPEPAAWCFHLVGDSCSCFHFHHVKNVFVQFEIPLIVVEVGGGEAGAQVWSCGKSSLMFEDILLRFLNSPQRLNVCV